jgi:hypothetical protein
MHANSEDDALTYRSIPDALASGSLFPFAFFCSMVWYGNNKEPILMVLYDLNVAQNRHSTMFSLQLG